MKRINDATLWNQSLLRLPRPHILQSWEWGAFKARHGWQVTRWLLEETDQTPRAAASVLCRRLTPLPFSILYVPKGPLLDVSDDQAWDTVLDHLERLAYQEHAILIKIDPDVKAERTEVVGRLVARGWRPSAEQIQFRNTMLLDLTQDQETLLAEMKSKWRYNIRLAGRKGVKVRAGSIQDLPMLYDIYHETALRDQFIIRPFEYYQDAWGSFMRQDLAHPLIAEVKNDPIAMIILYHFGARVWYMYGASRNQQRNKMPNHLLQWEGIRWARNVAGCTVYDMWGAPDQLDETDPMWGVYRFKQGFGATFAQHIGAYDYPTSRLGYWLYTRLRPWMLAMMHRRHRKG